MGVLTQGKGDKISEGILIFGQSLKKVTMALVGTFFQMFIVQGVSYHNE